MAGAVQSEEALAAKFAALLPHLDERQRRLVMGAEARALGHGGIKTVARAAGISAVTVSRGVDELEAGGKPLGRTRKPGGGRKPVTQTDPGLGAALLALVEPGSRGDPESPLRWTTKSLRRLQAELAAAGHRVSAPTVAKLLKAEGFSLQANAKTIEGAQHPDRDAQFRYLNDQARDHLGSGDPVISVDTKKKELVGQFKNGGREWHPRGEPERVNVHDFMDKQLGKAIPYGVYDLAADAGWVSVGTDHDTAEFAVATIATWWRKAGSAAYPRRVPAADHRRRRRLQRLPHPAVEDRAGPPRRRHRADHHRVPPAARHQQMEQDRAPAVLPHLDELARTAPDQPRSHRQHHRRDHHPHRADRHAELDTGSYPNGIKITDQQMRDLERTALRRHDFHGEWNYSLSPGWSDPP